MDATARDGKGNIFVAKDAEEYTTYDSGVGSLESATHYYSVRKCAQRLLQTYANNSTNNNGFLGTNVVEYTLTKGVYTAFSLTIPGETTDVNFSFADDVVWPDGMSYDASTGILSGTPTGTGADVSGTFTADSWVKDGKVTFKFNFISDLTLNGTAMTDGQKVNAQGRPGLQRDHHRHQLLLRQPAHDEYRTRRLQPEDHERVPQQERQPVVPQRRG